MRETRRQRCRRGWSSDGWPGYDGGGERNASARPTTPTSERPTTTAAPSTSTPAFDDLPGNVGTAVFWLTVRDGTVVAVEEQFAA
jgi:hypothetical protein